MNVTLSTFSPPFVKGSKGVHEREGLQLLPRADGALLLTRYASSGSFHLAWTSSLAKVPYFLPILILNRFDVSCAASSLVTVGPPPPLWPSPLLPSFRPKSAPIILQLFSCINSFISCLFPP